MSPAARRHDLRSALRALRRYHAAPAAPVSDDPLELILWEQVAYLAPDAKRHEAFEALRERVGLSPDAIIDAPEATLRAVARIGGSIASAERGERMRKVAALVIRRWKGDLRNALRLPLSEARRALMAFPSIGEPGADKVLAFTRTARILPLDSNALRVVQRLGIAREERDYRASYRAAQRVLAGQLPRTYGALIEGAQLLRLHGQELCRRSAPKCAPCPLRARCPSAVRAAN